MKNRIYSIDILRFIAILGVILIHTTSRTLEQSSYDILRVPFPFYLNELARFAVPLFFLISGFLLSSRYHAGLNIKEFYKKRALKIVLPYFIWSVFFNFGVLRRPLMTFFSIDYAKNIILEGSSYFHLYFIPALVFMYIIFPFLIKYIDSISYKKWVIILTVVEIFLLITDYYFELLHFLPSSVRIFILNFYIFYLGMLMGRSKDRLFSNIQKWWFLWLITAVIGYLFTVYFSFIWYLKYNDVHFIGSQWRVEVVLYMIGLFGTLIYVFEYKIRNISSILIQLSKMSYFVYFIHVLYISVFWHLFGSKLFYESNGHITESLWFDPAVFIFVGAASFLTAWMVRKVKGAWIVGL